MHLWPSTQAPRLEKGTLEWYPNFLELSTADCLLEELLSDIPWRQEPILLFGKPIMQPRLTAWIGNPGVTIRYSGITMTPSPWPTQLLTIRDRLIAQFAIPFNGVLCNLYRDGRDSMGWHADDESYLGHRPIIPSLSLGSSRIFQIKPKDKRASEPCLSISLTHGSLLLMAGDTQTYYKHQIPKTKKPTGPRINLTFRHIKQ